MIAVNVLIAALVGGFWLLVAYALWCSAGAVRARRRQARFDRARDTQGTGTL